MKSVAIPERISWLPSLLSRITLSTAFLVSGSGKFRHLRKDADHFRELGIPAPDLMAPFVAATEVSAGALLLLGFLTRQAAVPLMGIMAVAIATEKRDQVHSFSDLTGVFDFTYILLLTYLMTQGPGPVSIDQIIKKRKAA